MWCWFVANYTAEITNFINLTDMQLDDISVEVTEEVFNRTMRPMRVDTGAMRGSNVVTQNAPAQASIPQETVRKDARLGQDLLQEEQAKIRPRELNFLSSTLGEEYPAIWEEREQYRGRAAAAFESIVRQVVDRNRT